MKKINLIILVITSLVIQSYAAKAQTTASYDFKIGSWSYWNNGTAQGSASYWENGNQVGSSTYWENGTGPGSSGYWENGNDIGSSSYWLNGSGPGSWSYWDHGGPNGGTDNGSWSKWDHGTGPGSWSYWDHGGENGDTGPGTWSYWDHSGTGGPSTTSWLDVMMTTCLGLQQKLAICTMFPQFKIYQQTNNTSVGPNTEDSKRSKLSTFIRSL